MNGAGTVEICPFEIVAVAPVVAAYALTAARSVLSRWIDGT